MIIYMLILIKICDIPATADLPILYGMTLSQVCFVDGVLYLSACLSVCVCMVQINKISMLTLRMMIFIGSAVLYSLHDSVHSATFSTIGYFCN